MNKLSTTPNHEKANEYRDLCNVAGDVFRVYDVKIPNGYRVLDKISNPKNNFKAVTFEKGDEIVICYLGTNPFSIKDQMTNGKMAISSEPTSQMESALDYCKEMQEKYQSSNFKVIGHSEGGSEAMYVGLSNNLETYTFNPYGLHHKLVKKINNPYADELVSNYCHSNDPVSKLRKLVGKTYIVESNKSFIKRLNPLGSVIAHKIEKFGDCTNAKILEDYKKEHKWFISNVDEIEITDLNLENMSTDLFSIYESEISQRLAKGEILKSSQAREKFLAGALIKVSGYVRDDGTVVDGYYRRRPNTAELV